ncbi:MAG TPA: hypothetical protein VMZ29_09135 [Candidatus Bathyarchaeia archaeon]|nr:hypothetical protein [Candidatus Bathyarchaeia archaeon]
MKKNRIVFAIAITLGTILLAGILLAVDYLYAGVQEKLLPTINPAYEPNLALANKVILTCSLTIFLGLLAYFIMVWYITRKEKIALQDNEIIDQDGSLNFRTFQYEISSSIKILRDLFGYLIIIVIMAGLFSFLRFIWIFGKYRSSSQIFIEYYLTNVATLLINLSLYLALGFMISYLVINSFQKYIRLQIISLSYDNAMKKVIENFDRLMDEEKSVEKNSENK